jgi:polysaccharide biosynthesis protein PelA
LFVKQHLAHCFQLLKLYRDSVRSFESQTHPVMPLASPTFRFPRSSAGLLSKLLAAGLLGLIGITAMAADLPAYRSLFVDQSPRPDVRSLAAFDLSILNPRAELDMEPGHALGSHYFALLDIAHLLTGSREAMLSARRRLSSKPSASDPHTHILDLADPQWASWVIEALADPVAKKGFDGFVLSLGAEASTPAARTAVLSLAATLHQRYPDKHLLLDLRLGLGVEAVHVADGFLALGVYTREGRNGAVDWTSIAETQRRSRLIRTVQMQGMRVFAVDYASAGDRSACREAAQRLISMGTLPFITTPALDGINLGPLEEVSRRVLVLHGWDEKHVGEKTPPAATTTTSRLLRQSLEWLGCELEFRAASSADFLPADHRFAAVILDSGLILSAEQQHTLAAWLPSLRAKNIPLLLTSMPWTDSAARHLAMQHLSLGGRAQPAPRLVKTNVVAMDSTLLRVNTKITSRSLGFLDLEAPPDAHIVLSLHGQDAMGAGHRFDQAFLTTWGGAWIDPAAQAATSQLNLPAFLAQWLGADHNLPVPDTTTREGRQVFYSHIDSAGFSTPSTLPGFPLCSEVMRDRILDRYLLPVTVSVCEADLRAWLPGQQADEAERLEHVARSIFEMPQVQAASNSFSRPSQWIAGIDITSTLNDRAQTTRHDLAREIGGSMSYIHRHLLPLGKEVSLMLWPANATPTSEALRYCRSMSVESLPTASSVDPTVTAPFNSVRMEPLALRCSFADVRTERGIAALEKTFDACAGEPLHAMTAAAYAASVRDARLTRILRAAADHWIILNAGDCRTLRLPATAGLPDMARCLGVSGYHVHQGQLYIHTMGQARTELVLTRDKPALHIHLAECSTSVEFMELTSRRATFQVRDLRPVEVVLGGFAPRGQCAYIENGRPYTANADSNGIVHFEIARTSTVSLQSLPPAMHAAMR